MEYAPLGIGILAVIGVYLYYTDNDEIEEDEEYPHSDYYEPKEY